MRGRKLIIKSFLPRIFFSFFCGVDYFFFLVSVILRGIGRGGIFSKLQSESDVKNGFNSTGIALIFRL